MLKQIGLGILQYSQDYGEKYPIVASRNLDSLDLSKTQPQGVAYGWADAVYPYLKSVQIFQCPQEETGGRISDSVQSGFTDYWFNARLNGREISEMARLSSTILSGDGNNGRDLTNARYAIKILPQSWIDDRYSPVHRHNGAGNYLFADGHVKAVKPEMALHDSSQKGFSFAPR